MLRERGINSLVAIPLVVEDAVIGVVHAGSEAYAQFTDDDARLLELIADRIALAIKQASPARGRAGGAGAAAVPRRGEQALLASSLDARRRRCARRRSSRRRASPTRRSIDLVDGGAIARVVIEVAEGRISSEVRDGLLANPPSPEDDGGDPRR